MDEAVITEPVDPKPAPPDDETAASRSDRIYGELRDRICLLVYPPGTVLSEIALAKGKKLHDKRASDKDRDWNREKQRVMKNG